MGCVHRLWVVVVGHAHCSWGVIVGGPPRSYVLVAGRVRRSWGVVVGGRCC
jgi:hypothetical protein